MIGMVPIKDTGIRDRWCEGLLPPFSGLSCLIPALFASFLRGLGTVECHQRRQLLH
jgi:hypothetical protein